MVSTATTQRLQSMPMSERLEELESTIVSVLKSTLLMSEDESLSTSESFFDMGLTSLALTEAKEQLETLLGCHISATVLFNSPTIEQLAEHISNDVLPDVFETADSGDDSPGQPGMWDDVMRAISQR